MKVKVLSRDNADYMRERATDIQRVQRNLDPALHPFEKAREYTRALNAVKLERVFAKPFVGQLEGHSDGVYCMAKDRTRLSTLLSGACDGEVRVWSLINRKTRWSVTAHRGFVRGICVAPYGESYVTVGEDKTIKQWRMVEGDGPIDPSALEELGTPLNTILGKNPFSSVDHHFKDSLFATSGVAVEIWDEHRSEPINVFSWGADTVTSVRFNPVEVSVLAATSGDRGVSLYDIRSGSSLKKVILEMRANAVAWNPMEAFNFTVACEDHNCYTFDMRKLDMATNVHKDHVSAVMDIDYSPTGRQFVTGAYDRTVRIYDFNAGHSGEIYHTRRMQRIFSVKWSLDAKYILCGSDETNIRLWKADASEKIGTKAPRERAAIEYAAALKDRFKHHPEIRRIMRHRHVPKAVHKAAKEKKTMQDAAKVREDNRRKHSKPGAVPHVAERKKHIVTVQD